MTTEAAYQTYAQRAYWGADDRLTDIGRAMTGMAIPSQLTPRSRPVLGSAYPELVIARVDYRPGSPEMLTGAETDALVQFPESTLALVQTDSLRGLVMAATVAGVPEAAGQADEIISNVTFQPRGIVYRCVATEAKGNVAVQRDHKVFVVITSGAGQVSRGTPRVSGVGIHDLGDAGGTVTVASGVSGWVLDAEPTGIGV